MSDVYRCPPVTTSRPFTCGTVVPATDQASDDFVFVFSFTTATSGEPFTSSPNPIDRELLTRRPSFTATASAGTFQRAAARSMSTDRAAAATLRNCRFMVGVVRL